MKDCIVYYKEIMGTVSENCTFSISSANKNIQIEKQKMLDSCLNKLFDISPKRYSLEYQANGKPYLASHPNIHLNISHTVSKDEKVPYSCIAMAFSQSLVGIDAEYHRELSPAFIQKFCSLPEYEACLKASDIKDYALRLWTLKESYVKFTGEGLSLPFHTLTFTEDSLGHFHLEGHPEVSFYQYTLPHGLCISVCVNAGLTVCLKPLP